MCPSSMKAAIAICSDALLWSPSSPRIATNTSTSRSGTTRYASRSDGNMMPSRVPISSTRSERSIAWNDTGAAPSCAISSLKLPSMIQAPLSSAHCSSSARRALSVRTPSGNCVNGCRYTAAASGAAPATGSHVEAARVERHADHLRVQHLEQRHQAGMPGVLEPHLVARLQQHAADQLDGLHRAVQHQHLLRRTHRCARQRQVARDRLAQRRQAAGGAVAQVRAVLLAQRAHHQAPPGGQRKLLDHRRARKQRHRRQQHVGQLHLLGLAEVDRKAVQHLLRRLAGRAQHPRSVRLNDRL